MSEAGALDGPRPACRSNFRRALLGGGLLGSLGRSGGCGDLGGLLAALLLALAALLVLHDDALVLAS